MPRTQLRTALLLALGIGLVLALPATARHPTFEIGFFYDGLAPYGDWIADARFGHVWRPVEVWSGWRPYVDGQWVLTDYGWTFVSDEPWGWATYHYGRWLLDPFHGWIWVPGYEWAPAWVVFHHGGGYVGWAPLPPVGVVAYRVDPRAWCFVEERWFVERPLRRYALPTVRNAGLVRATRNVTRYARAGDLYRNRSLAGDALRGLERSAGRPIVERRLVDVPRPMRTRLETGRVELFRPRPARAASTTATRGPERRAVAREVVAHDRQDPRALAPARRPEKVERGGRVERIARVEAHGRRPELVRSVPAGRSRELAVSRGAVRRLERPIGVRGVAPRLPHERGASAASTRPERGRSASDAGDAGRREAPAQRGGRGGGHGRGRR